MFSLLPYLTLLLINVSSTDAGIFSSCCGSKDDVHEMKAKPPKYHRLTKDPAIIQGPRLPLWARDDNRQYSATQIRTVYANPQYTPSPTPPPYDWECTDILTVIPNIARIDRNKMKQKCQSRVAALHKEHNDHQSLIQYEPINIYGSASNQNNSVDPNSHLIILDLDETIMDQRSFFTYNHVYEPDTFWKSINANDLVINFNQFNRRHHRRRNLKINNIGIFRPFFMNFLGFLVGTKDDNPQSNNVYDAMLYSAAIGELVIYHAVTLEMYFNFVYAVKHNLNRFEFKHVISRAKDIRFSSMRKPKSLSLLMRIIGNYGHLLGVYKNIVIMDDMASKVWNDAVPKEIVEANMNIVCYAPWEFTFTKFKSESAQLTDALLADVIKIREQDDTFAQMMNELNNLPQQHGNDKLHWFQYGASSIISGMG